jgi:hypothetical protein
MNKIHPTVHMLARGISIHVQIYRHSNKQTHTQRYRKTGRWYFKNHIFLLKHVNPSKSQDNIFHDPGTFSHFI